MNPKTKRAISSEIFTASRNPYTPVEPIILAEIDASKADLLGALILPLQHVYLHLLAMAQDPAVKPEGLSHARTQFCHMLRKHFKLKLDTYLTEDFSIGTGWKVWIVKHESDPPPKEEKVVRPFDWNTATCAINNRFVEDMM